LRAELIEGQKGVTPVIVSFQPGPSPTARNDLNAAVAVDDVAVAYLVAGAVAYTMVWWNQPST
jgi:hypothetical protein